MLIKDIKKSWKTKMQTPCMGYRLYSKQQKNLEMKCPS